MALRHLTAQLVPLQQGARPSPQSQRGVLGREAVEVQAPHPAVTGQAGPWPTARLLYGGLLRTTGLWGEGLGAQRAKPWNCFDVLRDGAWGRWGGEGPQTSPPPPFFDNSPACQAAKPSDYTEERTQGRAGQTPWVWGEVWPR